MIPIAGLITALAALIARERSPSQDSTTDRPTIAIESVAVVDVVRGAVVGPRTVLISDEQITAIEEPGRSSIPPTAVRVEGRGRYLIPGLVDMHVHLFNNSTHRPPNEWAFPLFIANGVTAVREMRTEPAQMSLVQSWRSAIARGNLVAPRVLAAGVAVPAHEDDAPDAVRQQVREAHKAGADFIKVFSEVRESSWRTILEEARAQGMPVCGHVPAETSLLVAATAGQRSAEHLMQAYEACSAKEAQWLGARRGLDGTQIVKLRDAQEQQVLKSFAPDTCDQIASALAGTGQAQVPTLVLSYFEAYGAHAHFRQDSRWRCLRPDEQSRWEASLQKRTMAEEKSAALRWEVSRQIVKRMYASQVPILAGTDAPMPLVYPGFALHTELELLVKAGLKPADALRAATIRPAEFLGLEKDSGSVAVRKRADLVLLDENPLEQISNTRRIRAVILGRRLFQRADLDALLDTSPTPSGENADD